MSTWLKNMRDAWQRRKMGRGENGPGLTPTLKEGVEKLSIIVVAVVLVGLFIYWLFEAPEALSVQDQATVSISLTVTSEINVSCSTSTVTLSPSIPGQTGGSATGSFYCTAETNDTSGYEMKIKEDHVLRVNASGDPDTYFADHPEVSDNEAYYSWQTPASGNEIFGFNITAGDDVAQKYNDNGSVCNAGTNVTDGKCWDGFETTDETVASRNESTPAGGVATHFGLKAEVAATNNIREGVYSNTLTITALTNP